jgi:secondary thiamine-phosphate synthase enzyme
MILKIPVYNYSATFSLALYNTSMPSLTISTQKHRQVIDLTDRLNQQLQDSNFSSGILQVFVIHTTCALTTADLDPGTDLDLLDALDHLLPRLKYRHPHDPSHVGDHILSSLIGPSLTLPVSSGRLVLGTWQRVILIEFNGPRQRQLTLTFLSSHS